MFPAVGKTTARAKDAATVASIALPPPASTSAPTWVAKAASVTIIARRDSAVFAPCASGQSGGKCTSDGAAPGGPSGAGVVPPPVVVPCAPGLFAREAPAQAAVLAAPARQQEAAKSATSKR